MSLYRVEIPRDGDAPASHVVVGWRQDWLGTVRVVNVKIDGQRLAAEPARPGHHPEGFRAPDGCRVLIRIAWLPFVGSRPMVWIDERLADDTIRSWTKSRRWTAAVSLLTSAAVTLQVALGAAGGLLPPGRASWSVAVWAASVIGTVAGMRALMVPYPGWIWAAVAAAGSGAVAARLASPEVSPLALLLLASPSMVTAGRQIQVGRMFRERSKPAASGPREPPPPAGG